MSQKMEIASQVAEKFTQLDAADKSFVLGYITGKQEERARQEISAMLKSSCVPHKPEGDGHGGAA